MTLEELAKWLDAMESRLDYDDAEANAKAAGLRARYAAAAAACRELEQWHEKAREQARKGNPPLACLPDIQTMEATDAALAEIEA